MVDQRAGPDRPGAARPDGAALLGKACDVLEAVAAAPGGIAQRELAARLGLSRTTLYRILGVLVARGLLRQDPSRRVYGIGFRLMEMAQGMGQGLWSAPDLPALAAPELRQLRDATGETAYIAVLEGREVVGLGKFEGPHEVRSAARLGQRKPLHCTSQGKAILAFLPEAERDALLRRQPLASLTPHTITDRRRLAAALRIIRARGFATDDEEIVEGVRCVGAPVLDPEGRVAGAVSIAGPAWRMTRERLDLLGPEVAAAGRRIGAQLRAAAPALAAGALARPVSAGPAFRGLAPRWSAEAGVLWWCDALAPELRCLLPGGTDRHVTRAEVPIRALALATGGDALVVDVRGLVTRASPDGTTQALAPLPAAPFALRAGPGGEAWAAMAGPDGGSVIGPLSLTGLARVAWRLPGEVTALAWAQDGAALFAATPALGTVHRLEPGRSAPLLLARLPPGSGRPAGLAVDAEGGVWTALSDGWGVARLGPEGEVDRLLPLPVPRPTDLCFGGPGLETLFVATARDGVPIDTLAIAPLSGRLLALDAGVRGLGDAAMGWP
ncbi:SMP-30/gluconolactonase/LRE family protein [Roseomonas sp. OT10]|uniref:IclR family transcriptional regulator domain-containing protein n=1 Tax=Roseomonas cutis TaxID=2897332 RepID=UPI001E3F1C89|nr:IclR family transcriptional regulator C-terminal domain-containing protein [Roseomonas sp. OT10]UFN48283.1 SMP-30/gluconolactonase/LRE family protein [Roseomonas sp. OT10]